MDINKPLDLKMISQAAGKPTDALDIGKCAICVEPSSYDLIKKTEDVNNRQVKLSDEDMEQLGLYYHDTPSSHKLFVLETQDKAFRK